MNQITITITGVKQTPEWVTLQETLRQATGLKSAFLTRIDRVDRGIDYRAPGIYDLHFTDYVEVFTVTLVVNP